MQCADCQETMEVFVTCSHCGKKVCSGCFYEFHDGQYLPFSKWPNGEVVEKAVERVN